MRKPSPITRRRLLALLPAATLQAPIFGQSRLFARKPKPRASEPLFIALFGTDTEHAGAKGILSAQFNPATGQFLAPTLAAACHRPSFFALNRAVPLRPMLYVANEGSGAATSTITSYAVSPGASPAFTQIGQVSSAGAGPCYVAVDPTGRTAAVANYNGGSVATYVVQPDGTLSAPVERVDFHDKAFGHHGPVAARQEGPHPHSAMFSPDNRFLIVNDLGNDNIVLFPVDVATARLGAPRPVAVRTPGRGPRHLAFHPNGRWAYGIDELSNQIDLYLWNETHGGPGLPPEAFLTHTGHTVSTLDPGFHGPSTAAEIVVGPAGNFVYASNRGENTLVAFRIEPATGALAFVQRIPCGGKTPRHFTFDPSGRWLVCGNQDSASITVFARDNSTGQLTGPVQTLAVESPMFTLFL